VNSTKVIPRWVLVLAEKYNVVVTINDNCEMNLEGMNSNVVKFVNEYNETKRKALAMFE